VTQREIKVASLCTLSVSDAFGTALEGFPLQFPTLQSARDQLDLEMILALLQRGAVIAKVIEDGRGSDSYCLARILFLSAWGMDWIDLCLTPAQIAEAQRMAREWVEHAQQ
jgi:hypothetical protein